MDAPKCRTCGGQTMKDWNARVYACPCGDFYKFSEVETIELQWKDKPTEWKAWKKAKDKELKEATKKPKKVKD